MKNYFRKHGKTILILALAFLIPLIIVCAAFYINGLVPFGDKTVLIWDSKLQYKDYFGYLWDVLHGNASLDYSASKSLGGKMVGLVAYYLTCPLNLLMYFLKKSQIGLFFSISTILKISFAGLTGSYFIKKRFNIHPAAVLILSTCYALMEYNVYYCRNIMWLDGAVMLPLACLGAYELLHNRKKGLLFFSIAVAIISNWYSGFMVCLMTGFYFLFEFVLKYDFREFKSIYKHAIGDCVRFVADMLLSVAASAVVLLPACMSLVGGKAHFRLLYAQMNFSFLYTFKGFDIYSTVNTKESPLLYCGGIALLLVVYLFFDKRIDIKKRIASALLFVFMIFSFCFKELELMWTAFVQSHSYNFRFAFVFGFVMILLAAMAVGEIQKNSNKINKKAMLVSLGVIAAVALVLDLQGAFHNRFVANVYLFVFAVYGALMLFICNGKKADLKKKLCIALTALILFGELGANAAVAFREYNLSNSQFEDYTENMSAIVNEMKEKDSSFYRFEKNYSYLTEVGSDVATCEALLFGYNSIEHYSSTYDINVDEFMATMGYSDSTYVPDEDSEESILYPTDTYWNSPMLLTDSLLGIKYQLSQSEIYGAEKIDMNTQLPGGYSMYQNKYALPIAYNVSADLESKPEYGFNPFENQQKFISAMIGEETAIYSYPDAERVSFKDKKEIYQLTAKTDGPMYVYADGTKMHSDIRKENCELYVNGEYVQNMCQRFLINAEYIGDYKAGDIVTVEIRHVSENNKDNTEEHTLYAAQLDMDVFENVYSRLSSGSSTDLNVSGNTVSGTYTTDIDSTVMLSIPYADGWSVYVDGQKADYKELAGTFIGLDLAAGTHEITMKYSTPYFNIGAAGTIVGIAGFAVWCVLEAVIRKKKVKTK